MLAFVGFIFPDVVWKLPNHPWTSVEAHDKAIEMGSAAPPLASVA